MRLADLQTGIGILSRRFQGTHGALLADGSEPILSGALSIAQRSHDNCLAQSRTWRQGMPRPSWTFEISRESPLKFIDSKEAAPYRPFVDLSCRLSWSPKLNDRRGTLETESFDMVVQDILVRIWSSQTRHIFRPSLDSTDIEDAVTNEKFGGRVMARWHFDLASSGQDGPEHHVQFGGKPRDDEFCWFPEQLNVPRLLHPPMDLFLAVELIAANFYRDQYASLHGEAVWLGVIRSSQSMLYRPFYEKIDRALTGNISVLRTMWNKPW